MSYEGSISAKIINGFYSKQFIPAADYAAEFAFTSQIQKKFDICERCLPHNFLLVLIWPVSCTENNKSRIQLAWIGLSNRLYHPPVSVTRVFAKISKSIKMALFTGLGILFQERN